MRQTITTPHQMGEILSAGRRRAGLTQAEVAVRIGVSQSRISTLEADSGTLTLNQLLALFGAYGLQPGNVSLLRLTGTPLRVLRRVVALFKPYKPRLAAQIRRAPANAIAAPSRPSPASFCPMADSLTDTSTCSASPVAESRLSNDS